MGFCFVAGGYTLISFLSKGDKLKLTHIAAIIADDDVYENFILNKKKTSSLAPIIKSHDNINELSADIIR